MNRKSTLLPNGCRVSAFTVSPKNWKSKHASVRKNWYCRYRFYDRYGKVYQGYIAGVNDFETAAERRAMMEAFIEQELAYLRAGFNPITKTMTGVSETPTYMTWENAIRNTIHTLQMAETTKRDFDSRINQLLKKAYLIGFSGISVKDVKKVHIKQLLRETFPDSAYSYNKARAYLMMIYKELTEIDILEHNIIKDISKQKITHKIRETLTAEERLKVDQNLKANHYTFWRYLHIFYSSGARSTELLRLRRQDVDLQRQRFKTLVKKGKSYREVYRTITDVALPYWEELLAEPGEVVFSHRLKPGDKFLKYNNITQCWWKWVKNELGITKDFYSVKHLATSDLVDIAGDQAAAAHNAHTSTAMVVGIYDHRRADREHERIRKAGNKFV